MQSSSEVKNRQRISIITPNKVTSNSVDGNKSKVNIGPIKEVKNCVQSECNINLKYVTEAELEIMVKRVRRARQKKLDEENWQSFLRCKRLEIDGIPSDSGVCFECCEERHGSAVTSQHSAQPPQEYHKDMPKVEEVQNKFLDSQNASILETSIADSAGCAYQLGGVLTKRLQDLVATVGRMTSLLLTSVSSRSLQYEDEDVDRAIKRSIEFDAMFARNHLYEVQRLLKDAKQLAAGKSPRGELENKISAALKCITLAVQVYAKHVSKGSRVKYQQVVPIFQSISTLLGLLELLTGEHGFPFRQELEVSSSYMKQLLLEMSTADTQSVTTVSHKPARQKPATRHKPSADLSMYSRRRGDWRRKTASLARAKFGPPSVKKHCPSKESAAKEVPYRNATRAVPEDNVTTMMETIPNEELFPNDLLTNKSTGNISARSLKEEPNNVQLICLKEDERKILIPFNQDPQDVNDVGDQTILTVDEQTKKETLEYRQNMVEYNKLNPHYKDGKALGIVDRLATRILTEMVMDFQKEEMNNVIQTLYNLEFQ